ncbi:MAG TPA: cytochrome c [Pyrinomonadaceae bacterium]|nr:cytochrome c [Pyrinomonadaceae bacterium]
MRFRFIICLLLLSGLYLNEGPLNGQRLLKTNRPPAPANKKTAVKVVFKQHCAKCHGTDGRGRTVEGEIAGAQDFTDQDWRQRVEEQRIINSITHGRGQMPAFEKKLSKEQIKSLAAFVLTFKD